MSASLNLVTPDQCLVEHLVQQLSSLDKEELRHTLIIVPTQRLGTALLVRLLEIHTAIIPPNFMTLETIIRSRHRDPGTDTVFGIAHDATLDLILRDKLDEGRYKHLRHGHERELRLLYGELHDHGIRDSAFRDLKQTLIEDIYKSETHLGSLYERALEMEAILLELDQSLISLELRTKSQHLAYDARLLSENWLSQTQEYKQILFSGFTSMAKSWQVLLPALVADPRVSFWLSDAPKLYHQDSPLKALLETLKNLGPKWNLVASITDEIKRYSAYVAPSIREEVRWAKKIAQEALAKGFSLSKIGILITDERLYGTAIRDVFEEESLETNIALPESWGGTLAGRHLSLILQFWQERQALSGLLAFIDHPLTQAKWREKSDKLQSLRRGLIQANVPAGLEAMQVELREELQEEFEELSLLLRPLRLDQTLSLSQWLERLEELVSDFAYWESFREKDILQSSQEVFAEFTASLRTLGIKAPLLAGPTFWDLVESHLLKGSVRGTGEPLSGLQIMSLSEARYFPFDLAIILGCHEGCFPKALPQDELLDNYLKKRSGLPGWEMLEAMEDQTFHLLKARIPNLVLLRSARLGEEHLVRSRFTEALLARSQNQERVLGSADEITAIVSPDLEEEGQLSDWLKIATGRISASRLDKLMSCPFAFLMNSLGIQSEASKLDETDTRREGEWLHSVLQTFVTGLGPKGQNFGVFEADKFSKKEALTRINNITDALIPSDLRESSLVHHLKSFAWPRYIEHLFETSGAINYLREYEFGGDQHPVQVSIHNKTRDLQGRIDAIDSSQNWTFVTDFKRRTVPALDKTKKGFNPQLSLYAMALQQKSPMEPRRPLVLGYWNIYEGTWTAHGVSEQDRAELLEARLCTKNTPDTEQMIKAMKANWEWREQDIIDKARFYADPGDQCKLCDYAGLCRKDDPRVKDRIALQNALELRMETLNG